MHSVEFCFFTKPFLLPTWDIARELTSSSPLETTRTEVSTGEAEQKGRRSLRHQWHCGAAIPFVECLSLDFTLQERKENSPLVYTTISTTCCQTLFLTNSAVNHYFYYCCYWPHIPEARGSGSTALLIPPPHRPEERMELPLRVPWGSHVDWYTSSSSSASSSVKSFLLHREERTGRYLVSFSCQIIREVHDVYNHISQDRDNSPGRIGCLNWMTLSDTSLLLNFLYAIDLCRHPPHTNNVLV